MLLTISTQMENATDLGFLLHKHPQRCQSFDLSFGKAHVFYPIAEPAHCEACLLLDVDPIQLVRGKGKWKSGPLDQYVNDRPYVASSLMSVAISQVYGSALGANCGERPELAKTAIPIEARLDVMPVRGGESLLKHVFDPLGYQVTADRHALDERFPDWGFSPYYTVTLKHELPLSRLLQHLYVLMPVFDGKKHYYFGADEIDKLLAKGDTWLVDHPYRELIARRYLSRRRSMVREALERLFDEPETTTDDAAVDGTAAGQVPTESDGSQSEPTLHQQRLKAVLQILKDSDAKRVVDLGCGEGKLLRLLLRDPQFTRILGMDVSIRSLEIAHRRLRLDRLLETDKRIELIHGALTYRDRRLHGFDAATMVEVIEHLDPDRLRALERSIFGHAKPTLAVVTTPNREYNVMWEGLAEGAMRHADHRFEWTRDEFGTWAKGVADEFGYQVRFAPVGEEHETHGAPSQMAIFEN